MPAIVNGVVEGSIAEELGIEKGDEILLQFFVQI